MSSNLEITVNGQTRQTEASGETPLLYVLRNDLGLNGPRFGCGVGQCGACTVLIDGKAVRSCTHPVSRVGERSVVTLEGLGTIDHPHPIQQAFIDEQAAQCGICSNGMIMTAASFLAETPEPTEAEVKRALDSTLCRCGSHLRIVRAVLRAADAMQGTHHGE